MREEAFKRIGHLYPKVKVTNDMIAERPDLKSYAGEELTVIAWLWARTVKSPNPAFNHVDVPLVSNFILSSKKGKEAYVNPIIEEDTYHFQVKVGTLPAEAKNGTKVGRGGNFKCLISDTPIPVKLIREQGQQGIFNQRLLAVIAEGKSGRVYLSPTKEIENIANSAKPDWKPNTQINHNPRDIRTQLYGLNEYDDLFTSRQLIPLTTFSDLIQDARNKAIVDAKAAGLEEDGIGLDAGELSATAYGEALTVYLAFAVDRLTDYNSSCSYLEGIR